MKLRGASHQLVDADQFAIAVVESRLEDARAILNRNPDVVRTGNPEEDRLLADVAGRNGTLMVAFLIQAGADLTMPGLDDGTPLHQAAWFGQPKNVELLIEAGAPLDIFDVTYASSPIGWAVHGSKYSGGSQEREEAYVKVVRLLISAGSSLHYPGDDHENAYLDRLLQDASSKIKTMLEKESR